jgi:hypothetical protein
MLNCKFISFRIAYVYCTDTILDQGNKLTQEITVQSIANQNKTQSEKKDQKVPNSKTASMKPSPAKGETRQHTAMDREVA